MTAVTPKPILKVLGDWLGESNWQVGEHKPLTGPIGLIVAETAR